MYAQARVDILTFKENHLEYIVVICKIHVIHIDKLAFFTRVSYFRGAEK